MSWNNRWTAQGKQHFHLAVAALCPRANESHKINNKTQQQHYQDTSIKDEFIGNTYI